LIGHSCRFGKLIAVVLIWFLRWRRLFSPWLGSRLAGWFGFGGLRSQCVERHLPVLRVSALRLTFVVPDKIGGVIDLRVGGVCVGHGEFPYMIDSDSATSK
jgi:hypothetical protein